MEKGVDYIGRHMARNDDSKGIFSEASMVSTSGNDGDSMLSSEEFVRDESNLLSLHPWIFKKERYREGMNIGVDRSRGFLRSRRLRKFSVKPVDFMGNYFTPFGQHVDMEGYLLSSPPNSPTPFLRPFVVSDGSKIISKSSYISLPENGLYKDDCLHKEADGVGLGGKRAVIGVPFLPDSRKSRRKCSEVQHARSASNSQNHCKAAQLEGSRDKLLPFRIGICIGMISALFSKRTEVDELNRLLKQSEDLVQDLQEELEMKDSLSVKELAYGTCESQKLKHWNCKLDEANVLEENHNLIPHSTSLDECDHVHSNKAENSESLRKIEAELEAELERLEQNMNACNLEQRMSDLSELDPDLIVDVVHGELRANNLAREIPESQAHSHDDASGASTAQTYNANYCVSPKELSLRLHEVIQTRLEERIAELERELLRNQKQLQVMEAGRESSGRTFSNSDMGFSSDQECPRQLQPTNALANPFCLNLSGDALDAYDEAYEEFMQMSGNDESPVSPVSKAEYVNGFESNSSSRSLPWDNILWSRASDETIRYEEDVESGGSTDEEGKMLIQQLVEKTRQGSSALKDAQKMFRMMDEQIIMGKGFR